MILVARTSISLCQKYIIVSDTDRAAPISTAANLKSSSSEAQHGTRRSLDRLWACADGKFLVVVGEDVLKMTGWAYDEEVAARSAKYEMKRGHSGWG
jgi:hypothetical protein